MAVSSEKLLSLDMGLHDCLYRIQRDCENERRIVYVKIIPIAIIPEEDRTYGPTVIQHLKKVDHWYDHWDTLTVSKYGEKIEVSRDAFPLHALDETQLLESYSRFNVLDLEIIEQVKNRVFRVKVDNVLAMMKLARFAYEVKSLTHELMFYHYLNSCGSSLIPRLIGYVYEQPGHRVIGILLEQVTGSHPEPEHFERCKEALQGLHELKIMHGDINKYNMIASSRGLKFIDFENSKMHCDRTELEKEMSNMKIKLGDESDEGKPWSG